MQCGFRGLPVGGALRDLQDRIRKYEKGGMSETLKEACEKMGKEFETNNSREIARIWSQSDDNEKFKLLPERLLYESLVVNSGSAKKTLVVPVDDWGEKIEKLARQMDIHCEMRKMPDYKTGQRLVVLGLDEQSVRSEMAEMDRKIQRSAQRARQEQEIQRQQAKDDFDRRFSLAQSKGRDTKKGWDITGEWEIDCPYIEAEWGSEGEGCYLEIGLTKPTETGQVQMYASFDFMVITGIMRFSIQPFGTMLMSKKNTMNIPMNLIAHLYTSCFRRHLYPLPKLVSLFFAGEGRRLEKAKFSLVPIRIYAH